MTTLIKPIIDRFLINYNSNHKSRMVLCETGKDLFLSDGIKNYNINLTVNNINQYNTNNMKECSQKINILLKELKRSQLSNFKNREVIHVENNYDRKHYLIDDFTFEKETNKRKRTNKRNYVNWFDSYISASRVRNYMLDDPFLDYLKFYGADKIDSSFELQPLQQDKFTNYIMEQGNLFEENLFNKLLEDFNNYKIKQICYNVSDIHNMKKYSDTIKAMQEGTHIIYQGLLLDKKNKLYGSPDLLVRSDIINDLFPTIPYNVSSGCKFDKDNHYIVCDIKGTTIHMNSDDITMRNSGSMKAFKGQLYIYQDMLNKIQETENMISVIWGKKKKNESKKNYYHIDDISMTWGMIDFNGKDKEVIEKVGNSLKWLRELKENGSNYELYPKPSHPNLYPNMKNDMNNNFGSIKKRYAHDIKEITCVYNCGVKRRRLAHDNNITEYDDSKLSAAIMGFKETSRIGNLVDNILNVNRKTETNKILPSKINSSLYNWRTKHPLEIFIDFETINSMVDGIEDSRIFMIGIGYEKNNQYVEKCFVMKKNTKEGEINMFNEFYQHVENLEEEYNCQAKYYHWYDAEPIFYNRFLYRTKDLDFVDLEKLFRDEPITIKGSLNFKLKSVATAMYNHGMISTCWDSTSECSDGRLAMILANNLYRDYDNFDDIMKTKTMKDIVKYNLIDVKVLYEILDYLRNNH